MKRQSKPRFVIADPSLVDTRGHHFSLSLQVMRGARHLGCEVLLLSHLDFVPPPELDEITVHRVFSASMYDRYRPENRNKLMVDLDRMLYSELREGIDSANLTSDDHVFFHTGYGDVYRALAHYLENVEWRQGPIIHVCTPYDLETMPGRTPGADLDTVFRSIRTWEAVDKKLFFWAETPQLARYFTATYGYNVRALPLPVPGPLHDGAEYDGDQPVTALYLGAAREEKGFLHLPELADKLFEPFGRLGQLRFVIQCTPQIIGYQANIKQALEHLRRHSTDFVQLIDVGLSEEDYFSLMKAADVLLLLYNQKKYRIRGSGIAVEAVCANRCLLTYRDTFCASLITEGGGAFVSNVDEAAEFLTRLIGRRAEYHQKAARQGDRYRSENDTEQYVGRIMTKNDQVPFFPGSLIGHVSPSLIKM